MNNTDSIYIRLKALHGTSPAEARREAHAMAAHEAMHLVHGKWTPEAQDNARIRIKYIFDTLSDIVKIRPNYGTITVDPEAFANVEGRTP